MELDLLAKSLSAKNALRHAAAQRTHAADVANRVPKTERLRFTGASSGEAVSAHPPRT